MNERKAIYLDHQATTRMDERVLQKMLPYFSGSFGNPHAADHAVGWESSRLVAQSAAQIAGLIGADPDEVFFTSGATEANNLAILGLARRRAEAKRDRVLISAIEHKSVAATAEVLREQFGYQVGFIPVDTEGCVCVRSLENAIDERVLVVSIMAVNNEIGVIQSIDALADVAHSVGAVFHSDAAQAPVAMPMDAMGSSVDLLSLSAHKMGGPPGIGALYVRRDLQASIEPLIYGGGQQNGLRSGTVPLPLCIGMGAAADLLQHDSAVVVRGAVHKRRDRLISRLLGLPWRITVNGPSVDKRHPGNASVCFHGFSAHDILAVLQPRVAASTGSACTSGIPGPSHVLRAIGLSGEDAESTVRFSVGPGTTDEEIEAAADLIAVALERLSDVSDAGSVAS